VEKSFHRFTELFEQLGLASDPVSIKEFIAKHAPLDESVSLDNAPFWSISQSTLLREELMLDADWAEIVDQLNKDLRVR
jgi:formyltetrahydrofolate hydrolase